MKGFLSKSFAALGIAASQNLWAVPVTDTVIIGGQEWAQVNLFANVSWEEINTQCPGGECATTSSVKGYDMFGWTWASVDTVQALLSSISGHVVPVSGVYAEIDSAWAPWFFTQFGPLIDVSRALEVSGWTATPEPGIDEVDAYYAGVSRWLLDDGEWLDRALIFNGFRAEGYRDIGAWFVRDAATAPLPTTLALFGLGLGSLGIFRRKLSRTQCPKM